MGSVLKELRGLARNTMLLLAVKTDDDIRQQSALMRAYSTVVIGLGLGPRSWSLAKLHGEPRRRAMTAHQLTGGQR